MYILPNVFSFKIHTDINECAENNGGCAQICTNSAGSFMCSCNNGYILDVDRLFCKGKLVGLYVTLHIVIKMAINAIDVNECSESNGGCGQICTNTIGSFDCSCNLGYELNSNRFSCDGKHYFSTLAFVLRIRMH